MNILHQAYFYAKKKFQSLHFRAILMVDNENEIIVGINRIGTKTITDEIRLYAKFNHHMQFYAHKSKANIKWLFDEKKNPKLQNWKLVKTRKKPLVVEKPLVKTRKKRINNKKK